MTFAGNVVLIFSALDSGVKYYRKPGGDMQDKKAHRSLAVLFFLLCSPVGESLFTLFASLTYAYHCLMTLIK